MYWKLAIQNIRRSLRDYIIYFVTPVSYTHLDVYKRQSLGYLDSRAVYDIQISSRYNDVYEVENLPDTDYEEITAVSYTHLDVYKRQIFENTHEAIIDQQTFDLAQKIRSNVRRYPNGWGCLLYTSRWKAWNSTACCLR